jgi:hypothetical protein
VSLVLKFAVAVGVLGLRIFRISPQHQLYGRNYFNVAAARKEVRYLYGRYLALLSVLPMPFLSFSGVSWVVTTLASVTQ